MGRLGRFLERFVQLFFAPLAWYERVLPMSKHLEGIVTLLLGAGFLVAIGTALVMAIQKFAPGWGIVIGAVAGIFWVSFTAGRALELSAGPRVRVGPLQFAPDSHPHPCFYVRLQNGAIPLKRMIVKVTEVYDSVGIVHLEHSREAHWKGQDETTDPEFPAGEPIQAGLLGVGRFDSGNPTLFVWTKGEGRKQSISLDRPLAQQGMTKFILGVTSVSKKDGSENTQYRTFFVSPDLKGSYKVAPRWRWLMGRITGWPLRST